jgi:hypothetical protein
MSFNVAVVCSPVAVDDRRAWDQLDEQVQAPGEPDFRLTDFISALTMRYPCICELADEEVDEGVWSDGPLHRNAGNRAAVLGIVYSKVYEVLPYLLETADRLGLTVFDFQNHTIHRSGRY